MEKNFGQSKTPPSFWPDEASRPKCPICEMRMLLVADEIKRECLRCGYVEKASRRLCNDTPPSQGSAYRARSQIIPGETTFCGSDENDMRSD